MTEHSLNRLEMRLHGRRPAWFIVVVGLLLAALVPLLLLEVGCLLQVLAAPRASTSATFDFGAWIHWDRAWFGAQDSQLLGVTVLLVSIFLTIGLHAFLQWLLNESVNQRTLDDSMALHRQLHEKSHALALVQSVSGQQAAMRDAINVDLPRVREFMTRWHQAIPRHAGIVIGCWLLAMLIQPVLTVLATVGLGLCIYVYRVIEQYRRTKLPVLVERHQTAIEQLSELNESGPLLSSVHEAMHSQDSLDGALKIYRQTELELMSSHLWRMPVVATVFAILSCALGFVVAVRILDEGSTLNLSAVLVLIACLAAAAFSFQRLARLLLRIKPAQTAAANLLRILEQPVAQTAPQDAVELKPIAQRIHLEHVTLKDSHGRKLLEDISLDLRPRQLTSIVASDPLQARALAELLLGFGRPTSGRMIYDNTLSTDLEVGSVRRQCHWIGANGPLVAGTIAQNLAANGRADGKMDLLEALRLARVLDAIQDLADGTATLVTPHDGRLSADSLFRIGIARSILKQPSLIVAEEPKERVRADIEMETYESLRQLATSGMVVVVLPNRLTTIRSSDQIILLHDHRVNGQGTHDELLESSELYRHLNYIRFSPLRHVSA